jgi:hypothetical protein
MLEDPRVTLLTSVRVDFRDVPFELERSPEGGYIAFNDDLQIVAHGETEAGAEASFKASVRELIRYCAQEKLPLPGLLQQPA